MNLCIVVDELRKRYKLQLLENPDLCRDSEQRGIKTKGVCFTKHTPYFSLYIKRHFPALMAACFVIFFNYFLFFIACLAGK